MTTVSREYWNEQLETLPWAEVERWQVGRIAAALSRIHAGSAMYREMFADMPGELEVRRFADLARLPFTMKDRSEPHRTSQRTSSRSARTRWHEI